MTQRMVDEYAQLVLHKMTREGFKTNAYALGATSMKIGLHMSSFRVDTALLGHNARVGRENAYGWNGIKSPKGYKRTDVPTWDQRVLFNDFVNEIFDKHGISATIKSGCFTIRIGTDAKCESDWFNDSYGAQGFSSTASDQIVPEIQARIECDSDRLEAEHKESMKSHRAAVSKARREKLKAFKSSPKVIVSGFYSFGKNTDKRNGTKMTHKAFEKMLLKLKSSYEFKRVKEGSINATVERVFDLSNVQVSSELSNVVSMLFKKSGAR